jgi:hypothetical protein
MIIALIIHINAKFNFNRNISTLALLGLIILSVVPAMFSGFSINTTTTATNIVQTVLAQGEDPFPLANN